VIAKTMKKVLTTWGQLKSWQKVLLALVAGISTGLLVGPHAIYLKPIGSIFINGINMMVTPVVFTAIVSAVMSINDPKRIRRLGLKTLTLYICSMLMAALLGILVALTLGAGENIQLNLNEMSVPSDLQTPAFMDILVNIIPSNPVNAFAHGNILQILVFAVLLGLAINLTGEAAEPVVKFIRSFAGIVMRLTQLVMSFAPIGIFALMAWVSGEFGVVALLPLLKVVISIYLGCILYWILFYSPMLKYGAGLSPLQFFKRITNPIMLAFSSASSAVTLPVTLKTAEENLGISPDLGRFLLPLGMSLNMNGLSLFLGIAAVFSANIYHIHLGVTQYITLLFTILLCGMGVGGVPGTGIIALSAVLTSIGIPLGTIPLLAGIDRINDMIQTTTNVTGDLFTATMIAKSENELDLAKFNGEIQSEVVNIKENINNFKEPNNLAILGKVNE